MIKNILCREVQDEKKITGFTACDSWARYCNTNVDPYELPYKPGGMIFFSWDTSGRYFSHVGIVVSYNEETKELTYINGNVDYAVTTRVMDLDTEESYHGSKYALNANRIMAYAEYAAYTEPEKKTITAEETSFDWTRGSDEEIVVKTDSVSKTVRLAADCGFKTDNQSRTGQLILRYGDLTIGAAILDYLPDGENEVTLSFADGDLTVKINVTTKMIEAEKKEFVWKRNSEAGLTVQTTSTSDSVTVYGDGFIGRTKTGEASIEDGLVTLTARFLNQLENGKNTLTLVFSDGGLPISITAYIEGWQKEGTSWYYYLEDGTKKTGWFTENGKTYYLEADGAMKTGWALIDEQRYYFNRSGAMACGWKKISDQWYFFGKDGALASDEWVKGYWINKDGVWIGGERAFWHKSSKGWWYGNSLGYLKDGRYRIDGVVYSFDLKGYCGGNSGER